MEEGRQGSAQEKEGGGTGIRGKLTGEAQSLATVPEALRAHGLVTARKATFTTSTRSDRAGVVGRDTQPKIKGRQVGHRPISSEAPGTKPGPDRPTGGTAGGGETAGRNQNPGKERAIPASAGKKGGIREEEGQR